MSTVFRIQVDAPPDNAENVIRQAFQEIERLENVLSEWRDDSDISKVNAAAGKKSVKVGEDTLRVVDAGLDVSMWSRGAFDLSWAALWGLYDFRPDSIKIPTTDQIKPRLKLIDYKSIRVSKKYKTVAWRWHRELHDLRWRPGPSARRTRRPPLARRHPASPRSEHLFCRPGVDRSFFFDLR
jgi:thiamine biosynthesis lipoprotein ApbE